MHTEEAETGARNPEEDAHLAIKEVDFKITLIDFGSSILLQDHNLGPDVWDVNLSEILSGFEEEARAIGQDVEQALQIFGQNQTSERSSDKF